MLGVSEDVRTKTVSGAAAGSDSKGLLEALWIPDGLHRDRIKGEAVGR